MPLRIRPARARDEAAIAALRAALWPEGSLEEHREETRAILAGAPLSTMPLAIFVAEEARALVGFVEVGLRSHADGCDPTRPVGFVEGWYVAESHRGRGVGRALLQAAEDWSREHGCRELASDTWIDNEGSQAAHVALGFEVVDRCVHFKKRL
jgi:aminoglycoside 6'-N-acetyltransferase I